MGSTAQAHSNQSIHTHKSPTQLVVITSCHQPTQPPTTTQLEGAFGDPCYLLHQLFPSLLPSSPFTLPTVISSRQQRSAQVYYAIPVTKRVSVHLIIPPPLRMLTSRPACPLVNPDSTDAPPPTPWTSPLVTPPSLCHQPSSIHRACHRFILPLHCSFALAIAQCSALAVL